MAKNKKFSPGYSLTVAANDPVTPASGDPVRFGPMTGVAVANEDSSGNTVVDFGPGIWELNVDDDLGTGIALGDPIYYHDTQTGNPLTSLNNNPKGADAFFGYAMDEVGLSGTAAIEIMHPAPSRNGRVKQTIIAGGAAGNHAVVGITQKDELVSVLRLDFTDATEAGADVTAQFSITAADTINNVGGSDSTGGFLVVMYLDRSLS